MKSSSLCIKNVMLLFLIDYAIVLIQARAHVNKYLTVYHQTLMDDIIRFLVWFFTHSCPLMR
jgi:hypothetical protein